MLRFVQIFGVHNDSGGLYMYNNHISGLFSFLCTIRAPGFQHQIR